MFVCMWEIRLGRRISYLFVHVRNGFFLLLYYTCTCAGYIPHQSNMQHTVYTEYQAEYSVLHLFHTLTQGLQ